MTDFNAIFGQETEAQKQAGAKMAEVRNASETLYSSLGAGDYLAAGKVLQQTGSCKWQDVLKGDNFYQANNSTKFPAHLTLDKDKTSVEIFERISSHNKRPDLLVPRLTVTDDSCDKKLKK
jgi:hypothetical protein